MAKTNYEIRQCLYLSSQQNGLRRRLHLAGAERVAARGAAVGIHFTMRQDKKKALPHWSRRLAAGTVQLRSRKLFKLFSCH